MGNHDNRAALRRFLLDEAPSIPPLDRVRMIDGLRVITVDTSVPGFHHGGISTFQLDWLAEELATPDRGCHWPDSSPKSKRWRVTAPELVDNCSQSGC
jgi:3',5'-cyclic AMP phosphodiesterase CpdA